MLRFGLAAAIGKRQSAAGGRLLWMSIMASLVFLAAFEWATPKWGLSIPFPAQAIADEPGSAEVASNAEPASVLPDAVPSVSTNTDLSDVPVLETALAEAAPADLGLPPTDLNSDLTLLDRRPDPVESKPAGEAVPKTESTSEFSPLFPIACIWLAGTLFLTARFGISRFALRRLERRSGKPGASWLFLADHLTGKLGLRKTPRLLISPTATVPMAWGLLRPRILLPDNANDLDVASRRYLLQHELSHIVHRDSLALLISQVAVILHWPNPLVWLAHRRLRLAQERSCDDAAMNGGGAPADYAELLADIAKRGRETPFSAASVALTMANGSSLKKRITAILDPQMKRRPPRKLETFLTVLLLSVLTLGLAGLAVSADEKANATTPELDEKDSTEKISPPLQRPTLLRFSNGEVVEVRVFDESEDPVSIGARARQEDTDSALSKACELYFKTQELTEKGQKEGVVTASEALKEIAEARDRLETVADRYLTRVRDDLRAAESRHEEVSKAIEEVKGRRAADLASTVSGIELEQARQTFQNELRNYEGLKREAALYRLEGGAGADEPEITLQLRNVLLGEVLKYVAQLAGFGRAESGR